MCINIIRKLVSHLVVPALMLVLLGGCNPSNSKQVKEEYDKSILQSCKDVRKMGISSLSMNDQAQICNIMVSNLGRNPPVYLLRDLVRLVVLVKDTASDDTVNTIASDAMNVVLLRQQNNNDQGIQDTFDTIWKVYQSTETKITFNDLTAALKKSGEKAKSLSDDQLEKIGISLWQEKGDKKM